MNKTQTNFTEKEGLNTYLTECPKWPQLALFILCLIDLGTFWKVLEVGPN
jgi:hypothetical protein